jgi:hypothetical protein
MEIPTPGNAAAQGTVQAGLQSALNGDTARLTAGGQQQMAGRKGAAAAAVEDRIMWRRVAESVGAMAVEGWRQVMATHRLEILSQGVQLRLRRLKQPLQAVAVIQGMGEDGAMEQDRVMETVAEVAMAVGAAVVMAVVGVEVAAKESVAVQATAPPGPPYVANGATARLRTSLMVTQLPVGVPAQPSVQPGLQPAHLSATARRQQVGLGMEEQEQPDLVQPEVLQVQEDVGNQHVEEEVVMEAVESDPVKMEVQARGEVVTGEVHAQVGVVGEEMEEIMEVVM